MCEKMCQEEERIKTLEERQLLSTSQSAVPVAQVLPLTTMPLPTSLDIDNIMDTKLAKYSMVKLKPLENALKKDVTEKYPGHRAGTAK